MNDAAAIEKCMMRFHDDAVFARKSQMYRSGVLYHTWSQTTTHACLNVNDLLVNSVSSFQDGICFYFYLYHVACAVLFHRKSGGQPGGSIIAGYAEDALSRIEKAVLLVRRQSSLVLDS